MHDIWLDEVGSDVVHIANGLNIPAALIGMKKIKDALYPIIQYLAPDGELYPVKSRPYWLDLTMVVYPNELKAI